MKEYNCSMITTLVHVHVKEAFIQSFIEASLANSRESMKEIGNCRFDILQSAEDSSRFVLYEAYETAAHAAAHKTTAHYAQWRDTVAPMMEEPRKGIPYIGL